MIGVGALAGADRRRPVAESAGFGITPEHQVSGLLVLALALRAFSSGCTALTGVEAVSNGVPSFRQPKADNAAATLAIMGGITVVMFVGITALALLSDVHVVDNLQRLVGAPAGYEQRTVIAQVAAAVFGDGTSCFFAVQAFTAAILVLAANTAYNGFPILSLDPRRRRLPAAAALPSRRPAGLLQRHRRPRRARRRAWSAPSTPARRG